MLLRFQGAPILTLTRLFRLCFPSWRFSYFLQSLAVGSSLVEDGGGSLREGSIKICRAILLISSTSVLPLTLTGAAVDTIGEGVPFDKLKHEIGDPFASARDRKYLQCSGDSSL